MPKDEGWRDDWELAFPSPYLGSQHLKGKDITLTISRIERPELTMFNTRTKRTEEKKRLVLYFHELAHGGPDDPTCLLCNKTNARTIGALYGRSCDEWIGKRITVYPEKWRVDKETNEITWALRIRPERPSDRAPSHADEVKAILAELQRELLPAELNALARRIKALPTDLPDRPLLEKSWRRLNNAMKGADR